MVIDSKKTIIPNAMKVAFKELLEGFDEYKLGKYKNKGEMKLHDIVNLVHAKGPLIDKLMK